MEPKTDSLPILSPGIYLGHEATIMPLLTSARDLAEFDAAQETMPWGGGVSLALQLSETSEAQSAHLRNVQLLLESDLLSEEAKNALLGTMARFITLGMVVGCWLNQAQVTELIRRNFPESENVLHRRDIAAQVEELLSLD